MISKIEGKLLQYGFEIYEQHPPDENGTYIILTKDMILFLYADYDLGVSFQATTKPDVVARDILILKEIEGLKQIRVMESFIFNDKKQLVHGDEAFDLIKKSIENGAIKELNQQLKYSSLLTSNGELYRC
jgi:uncharacterized ubiquitin-like protein YukD